MPTPCVLVAGLANAKATLRPADSLSLVLKVGSGSAVVQSGVSPLLPGDKVTQKITPNKGGTSPKLCFLRTRKHPASTRFGKILIYSNGSET